MNEDFVMCARAVDNGKFIAEPGASLYLLVPPGQNPAPDQAVADAVWVKKLRKEAV